MATNTDSKDTLPLISISVIGHVDSGKSTLTGRLATRWGDLDERKLDKLAKVADDYDKSTFSLAYFTDTTAEERRRGVTINTTIVKMKTSKFRLNLFDCPGHATYLSNATVGCKQSDLSIVVVPADFTASCSETGMLGTHVMLAHVLGSKSFIVCINKLDEVAEKNASHVKTTFESAVCTLKKMMKKFHMDENNLFFLPISALKGVGVFKDGEIYDFYRDMAKTYKDENGKDVKVLTLEDAINIQPTPVRYFDSSLRMTISSMVNVQGHGTIYCGQVDFGCLEKGKNIKFLPSGIVTKVKSMQEHRVNIEKGYAGMNIGFSIELRDKSLFDKIKTGSIVAYENDPSFKMHQFYVIDAFSLKKGKRENAGIRAGYTPLMSSTFNVACKFVKLLSYTTKATGTVEDPEFIPKNAKFRALIYPMKECFMERAKEFPSLGRLVCLDSSALAVAGVVTECLTEEEAVSRYGVKMQELKGNAKGGFKVKAKK